jgi:hypothetical protein
LEDLRHRGEKITKMDLKDVGLGGMVWIDLAEDRDRWRALVTSLLVPHNAGNFLTSRRPLSFSGRILLRGVS